jgi:hypothetical protein
VVSKQLIKPTLFFTDHTSLTRDLAVRLRKDRMREHRQAPPAWRPFALFGDGNIHNQQY